MLSVQSNNNVQLRLNARHSDLLLSNWRILSEWLYQVTRMFELTQLTLVHGLWLLSDCCGKRDEMQLYGCACIDISCGFIEEYQIDSADWMHICDNAYTADQLITARNGITIKRNGVIRVITPLDIIQQKQYDSQPMEHVANIVILCYMYHPTFTTIPSDTFADACGEVAVSLNNNLQLTPLASNIRSMLQMMSLKPPQDLTNDIHWISSSV